MDSREIQTTLVVKLGAIEDRTSHHVYYWMNVDGIEFRVGKLSHSSRGRAPEYVVSDTAKRLKLNKKEFTSLVECSMDKGTHRDIWRSRG